MVSDALHVMTLRVITSVKARSSAAAPCAANSCTMSRSDTMPTTRLIRAGHNQRTDFPLGQKLGRSGQICRGLDGENLGALHG